jgi:hypothetical protein
MKWLNTAFRRSILTCPKTNAFPFFLLAQSRLDQYRAEIEFLPQNGNPQRFIANRYKQSNRISQTG